MLHSDTLYMQLISLLPFPVVCIWPLSHHRLRETTISSKVITDMSSAARPTRQGSQNDTHDFAQTLKRGVTFGARLKGCSDELKHRAFLTRSWLLCVSQKKKVKEKKKNKLGTRGGKIEHINWPGKWESLSLTPLSEWTIKISNMMFKAVGQANW